MREAGGKKCGPHFFPGKSEFVKEELDDILIG